MQYGNVRHTWSAIGVQTPFFRLPPGPISVGRHMGHRLVSTAMRYLRMIHKARRQFPTDPFPYTATDLSFHPYLYQLRKDRCFDRPWIGKTPR